jgi:hypothetical protein
MYVPLTRDAHNHEDRENSFQVSPTHVHYLNNIEAMGSPPQLDHSSTAQAEPACPVIL